MSDNENMNSNIQVGESTQQYLHLVLNLNALLLLKHSGFLFWYCMYLCSLTRPTASELQGMQSINGLKEIYMDKL